MQNYYSLFCRVKNCPHTNMVNIGQSSTHLRIHRLKMRTNTLYFYADNFLCDQIKKMHSALCLWNNISFEKFNVSSFHISNYHLLTSVITNRNAITEIREFSHYYLADFCKLLQIWHNQSYMQLSKYAKLRVTKLWYKLNTMHVLLVRILSKSIF